MEANKIQCNILFLSNDMEWIQTFIKGTAQFFNVRHKVVTSADEMNSNIGIFLPDVILFSTDIEINELVSIAQLQAEKHSPIPILVVAKETENPETFFQKGATYALPRHALLSAIRCVQQILQNKQLTLDLAHYKEKESQISALYQHLFRDFPEPIFYLQDGFFLDANHALFQQFKVENMEALQSSTAMNFVSPRSKEEFKAMIRSVTQKDAVQPKLMTLQDIQGQQQEYMVQMSHVIYQEESAVEVFLHEKSASSVSIKHDDSSMGLSSRSTFEENLKNIQKNQESNGNYLGIWALLWIENFREVLIKDGIVAANKLLAATISLAGKVLSNSIEITLFGDDSLLFYLPGDKERSISRFENLIDQLDAYVPENIGRLVHPHVFVGMQEFHKDSDFVSLVNRSYRAVRKLAASPSQERIVEPVSSDMSRNEERRFHRISEILSNDRIGLDYLPICSIHTDGIPRYMDVLKLQMGAKNQDGEEIDEALLLQTADRFELGRKIDRAKLNHLMRDFLSYSGEQGILNFWFNLSMDSLKDPSCSQWINSQLMQTGIKPSQITFCLSIDTVLAEFSGAEQFSQQMRAYGSYLAIKGVSRFDKDTKEVFSRLAPNAIILDLNEIDIFEDEEELQFMRAIKAYSEENKMMLIAGDFSSPAQLSRIWPYDINYIQGIGLVDAIPSFDFDFSKPLF